MNKENEATSEIIRGMRAAYKNGENAMSFARQKLADTEEGNLAAATLIAYDLQSGSYTAAARADVKFNHQWCEQLAELIRPVMQSGGRLLEVGAGEATTLAGVVAELKGQVGDAYGLDLSWSRVAEGRRWLAEKNQHANLFVGDLFHMPFSDSSINVVYSSHSLEPNGGKEELAIAECLRVASDAVVLVEPMYELANAEAQARMESHGYVRGLHDTAARLGAEIVENHLLENCGNELNPSGVLLLRKVGGHVAPVSTQKLWACPLTGAPLIDYGDVYFAEDTGIAYPKLRGIPLLRPEHAVVASQLESTN